MGGSARVRDALRVRIRALGDTGVRRVRVPCGVDAVDRLIGGLPRPGIVELSGAEGEGRARVALGVATPFARDGHTLAWVDPSCRLHPPPAEPGVLRDRLLVVRPRGAWAWATEQLLRSGCFPLVLVDLPPRPWPRPFGFQGWARAALIGGCTAIVLASEPEQALPADVRLATDGGRLFVVHDRSGRAGTEASLPPWPERTSSWG